MRASRLAWALSLYSIVVIAGCQQKNTLAPGPLLTSVNSEALYFWTPPDFGPLCQRSKSISALPTSNLIRGWNPENEAADFIDAIGRGLSASIYDPGFDREAFARAFVDAAEKGSFTRLDFEGPGGPSPVYTTSLVLISSAYAVSFFDHANVWSKEDRDIAIAWGAGLDANQNVKRDFASPDSIATIAAARLTWGAATQQPGVFMQGLRDFEEIGRTLDSDAYFERNPRDNNEVVAAMILGAEALIRSGIDAYAIRFNGKTLHDAVLAHAKITLKIRSKPITESSTGHTGTYFRKTGYAAHLAWIPIYLYRFSDTFAAVTLKELREGVAQANPRAAAFKGTNVGGPTSCLWAR